MGKPAGKIIIVRKKKKAHAAHHGGSWKVAYADFVTAMMAFFMVMWILGMDQQLRQAIEGYFSNPVGYKKGYSGGATPISSGASPATVKTNAVFLASREYQRKRFDQVASALKEKIDSVAQIGKLRARVEIIVTDAGLRIELIESGTGDRAGAECGDQRVLVDDAATGGIHEQSGPLHEAEFARTDQVTRLGCERCVEGDEVRLAKQFGERHE